MTAPLPACAPAPAARHVCPIDFIAGDTWSFVYAYRGPDNLDGTPGAPIDLTGFAITALLYLAYQATPITLALSADTDTNFALGLFKPLAPPELTRNAKPDPPGAREFPTRLVIVLTDNFGNERTLGRQPIRVGAR